MLLEHCVIAGATNHGPADICPMNCRWGVYTLRDAANQDYLLEPDKRCRNHIFTATDVCVLANLSRIASLPIAGLRIEGQLDDSSTVKTVTAVYRKAIDSLKAGKTIDVDAGLEGIRAATGRPLCDGAFDFQSVCDRMKEHDCVGR